MSEQISIYHCNNKYVTKSGEVKIYTTTRKYTKKGSKFQEFDKNDELQDLFKQLIDDEHKISKHEVIQKMHQLSSNFNEKQLDNYFYRRIRVLKSK